MKRFIILLISIWLVVFTLYAQNQPYEITMGNKIFAVLENNGQVVMAAGETTAPYPEITGEDLSNAPHNNQQYAYPEFLVLDFFFSVKNADMAGVTSLYDFQSQSLIMDKLNITEAAAAYAAFKDIRLLSKARFGRYVKLRYDMLQNDGKTRPWVLMATESNGRFYLTENMSLDHLFIDVSSASPYNFSRVAFSDVDTSGMLSFYFKASDLSVVADRDWDLNELAVFLKLTRAGSGTDVERNAFRLLQEMKASLDDTLNLKYIELWDEAAKQALESSDYARQQIEVQRSFYRKVTRLQPVAWLKAGDELVLFYFSEVNDKTGPLQLLSMRFNGKKWKLTRRLKSYYAWQILNEPVVKESVTRYLVR